MRPLEKFFDSYGRYVSKKPLPFLIVPLITTTLSCIGFFYFHTQNDIWDIYSPLDAISRTEEKSLKDFEYPSATHHYRMQILVDRKDGKNIFNKDDLNEISAINKFIVENITIPDSSMNNRHFYNDLCGIYCSDSNDLVIGFLQAILETNKDSSTFILTYPNAQALQNHVFMGYSIGQLKWKEIDDLKVVDEFKLFILHYMVNTNINDGKNIAINFEYELKTFFNKITKESKNLNYALLSRNRELEEQSKITLTAIPYLFLTGFVLTIFMLLTLINIPLYKSQHIEAIFGILSPVMALITTFGLLWGIGLPFSNILTVVPFLTITIGIDDAFLILAGWRHSSTQKDYESRMGAALAKSGASVSVTSITDVLCFGVGLVSQMPVVQLFCLYTSVALTIDFFYQITFFAAVVAICGKKQMTIEEKLNEKENPSISSSNSSLDSYFGKVKEIFLGLSTKSSNELCNIDKPNPTEQSKDAESTWLMAFVNFLHLRITRVIIVIIFIIHLCISIYLCTLVNTHFDMENLYLKESPLTPISHKMQNFMLNESFVVNFAVNNVNNSFNNPINRQTFSAMLMELENIPKYSMNDNGTYIWLRDYEIAISFWGSEDESVWEPIEMLRNYRAFNFDEKYINTKKLENGDEIIDSFYFYITYYNMTNFIEVEELLTTRRSILSRYSDTFNVTSHHPLEKVPTESAASAPKNFIQTAISAIILMSVLVLIFVMDIGAIFSVVLSILSISCGTVGYLHLWNVNLDAVSLISMLMSIGFSVDYSAHICYHYFTMTSDGERKSKNIIEKFKNQLKPSKDPESTHHRLEHTFNGVGWPVIQSGVSTVLGMVPLFYVNAYVVAVFWKTIILVTILGLWHALFLLPALFLLFNDIGDFFRWLRKDTVTVTITP